MPSLDRLKRGAQEALQRLHRLQELSLQKGDGEAALCVGAMIVELQELDQRIGRIRLD